MVSTSIKKLGEILPTIFIKKHFSRPDDACPKDQHAKTTTKPYKLLQE
jgi:hypothetical protein